MGRIRRTIIMGNPRGFVPKKFAGANMGRHETYRALLARGFRTEIQGVTMHRPNELGYNRPGVYIIDDWR